LPAAHAKHTLFLFQVFEEVADRPEERIIPEPQDRDLSFDVLLGDGYEHVRGQVEPLERRVLTQDGEEVFERLWLQLVIRQV